LEVQIPSKADYIPFFRLSEDILQELLPRLSEEQIIALVSNENWVPFPLPGEETKDEIDNRKDPHIDLKLTQSAMRIGLRCNTVRSVDKLENILVEYHSPEKRALIQSLGELEDDFQTVVYAKIKEHNWSERAEYQSRFQKQTNLLDEAGVEEMFGISGQIREEGRNRMKDERLPHNPVTPVIELCFTTIESKNEQLFVSKLKQLKPIYETCLKVKTTAWIKAEERRNTSGMSKMSTRIAQFKCPKCGKGFSKEEAMRRKFCDVDDMKIQTVFVYN
jgi:predicted RNA-binding Zn-ribbon protein involved in translation (DUF1610 family)